ncbi:MAG: methyltransferase domain-containing protein [Cyanobacteria bacterium SZAS-4]|nr:methyltransferase domain-containing protein [Cyanobacteria bacterium SZAS-4]
MTSFKEFEHEGWELVADKYHQYFEQLTRQTIPALMEEIESGAKVIDVASGPGYVAAAAAEKGGTVTGVDFSAVMVKRAQNSYPKITFVEGDAENLAFEEGSFDDYIMNFGILHLEHPEKALAEAHRVLRTGGSAAFTVWAPPDRSAGFRCVLENIQRHGDPSIVLPQGPAFFRFSDKYEFLNRLEDAGFKDVKFRHIDMIWKLSDGEAMFNAFFEGTPRTGGTLRAQSPEKLAAIKNAILESSLKFKQGGSLEIPMVSLLAVARK